LSLKDRGRNRGNDNGYVTTNGISTTEKSQEKKKELDAVDMIVSTPTHLEEKFG
jgi:hypothetical protein